MTPSSADRPRFDFRVDPGYDHLCDWGMVGFESFTQLQPWYFLKSDAVFEMADRWPKTRSAHRLVAFAVRQDNDDIACWVVDRDEPVTKVVLAHGWTPEGYEVRATYSTFWEWLKTVIDDMQMFID